MTSRGRKKERYWFRQKCDVDMVRANDVMPEIYCYLGNNIGRVMSCHSSGVYISFMIGKSLANVTMLGVFRRSQIFII